ncbi:MAG: hypothetical protein J5636_01435 [Clostridiales bacterium]|nr:hypothetical protein [Clostridiales bacterium]
MGLFGKKKDKADGKGGYSLSILTPPEKSAVCYLCDLMSQPPVQAGLKGRELENARCVGDKTYGQLQKLKSKIEKNDSMNADDIKLTSYVLTAGTFALGELVKKLQNEKVGGERMARAAAVLGAAKSAKAKVDPMLKKQDTSWESF